MEGAGWWLVSEVDPSSRNFRLFEYFFLLLRKNLRIFKNLFTYFAIS